MKSIFGKKVGMTQIYDEAGDVVPVTVVEVSPATVVQVKTKDSDGYEALQVGFESITKDKEKIKSKKGKEFKHLREIRISDIDDEALPKLGETLDVSSFAVGDKVNIAAISKGKGFQGGVKRWGFSGRNHTHGVKHEERTLGSVGAQQPQRVIKGKKMPGQMGRKRVTVYNLNVARVDADNNLIALEGAVPGGRGSLIEIKSR